jgi:hypothetical protein
LLTNTIAVRLNGWNHSKWYSQGVYGQKHLYLSSRIINENYLGYICLYKQEHA